MSPNDTTKINLSKSKYLHQIQITLSSILYLHKLFAIVPFNITTYKFQKISFLITTVVIYTMIYICLLTLDVKKQVNSSQPYIFKIIPIILSTGQIMFSALLLCICHARSYHSNEKLKKIVFKFVKIDQILTEQLGITIEYNKIKTFIFVFYSCVFNNIVNLYLFHKLDTSINLLFLFLFYLPNIYEKLYKTYVIVLNDMIKQRLIYLNKYLKNNLIYENIFISTKYNEMDSYNYEGLHYLQKLKHIKLTNEKLRHILRIHSNLCETSKHINESYGIQILISFIITFIVLVSLLFYVPVGVLSHLSGKNNLVFAIAHIYWFILKLGLCIWFTKIIADCYQEFEMTSTIAYQLMIEDKVPSLTNQIQTMIEYTSATGINPRKSLVVYWIQKIVRFACFCFSPCITSLFRSEGRQPHHVCSGIGCFLFSLVTSLIFYQIFLVDLRLDVKKIYVLAFLMTAALCLGNVFSQQIRVISLLTLTIFLGRSGQTVMKALILSFLVLGPVRNLADNSQEVIKLFSCSAYLTYNMTKTKYELLLKPFTNAILGTKSDNYLKESLGSIEDVVEQIRKEIFDNEESKHEKESNEYLDELEKIKQGFDENSEHKKINESETSEQNVESKYYNKLENLCDGMVDSAKKKCENIFTKVYDGCKETIHWSVSWALCWPMKFTFICNFALDFDETCEASKTISPGFGTGYLALNNTRNELKNEFKDVKLQYQVSKFLKVPDEIQNTFDTSSELVAQFTEKKAFAYFILWLIVKWILAFSFIRVIWKAEKYQRSYLTEIEFDNVYITDYFRKIDKRRKLQNKPTLLPLKKIEKKNMVATMSWSSIGISMMELLFEIVPVVTFVLIDKVFYEMLVLIRKHAYMEYSQTGYHEFHLNVKGTGLIASIVRSITNGLNTKQHIHVDSNNLQCLPEPSMVPSSSIYKMYGAFVCAFFMILLNKYLKRYRHLCCAVFFRKREKTRILYLYNETLRKRKTLFKFKKSRLSRLIKKNRMVEDMNMSLILRLKFPKYFNWLSIFSFARRKCIICNEPENNKWPKISCRSCRYGFCGECWDLIDHDCYICEPLAESEENPTDDDIESDKSEE